MLPVKGCRRVVFSSYSSKIPRSTNARTIAVDSPDCSMRRRFSQEGEKRKASPMEDPKEAPKEVRSPGRTID